MRYTAALAAAVLIGVGQAQPEEQQSLVSDIFEQQGANGVAYRIFTARPANLAESERLPVIYMIDGNRMFPLARERMKKTPKLRAILVGIGYPTEDREEIVRLRYVDLTPPTPEERMPRAPGRVAPQTGGRNAFFTYMQTELRPEIERRFAVDTDRQTLFGHSLGGLFALHVLFREPDAFGTYVAADPSVWWNGHGILAQRDGFLESSRRKNAAGRELLIETSGKRVERPGLDADTRKKLAALRSGPDGRDIFETLTAHTDMKLVYRHLESEGHGSMIPFSVSDALRFALLGEAPENGAAR
ncbi:alpha/beta hydrolase-fold protein [uncultured Nitratireductor sp.]|uniref:alpha/beta hydrolase n=1 Tax=uncultured Nitratireductor sp. TaxID=520953 RepID=UPI0025EDDF69|nr:alpha/beta hydrolase-fold protein [uncultured Nitratireductor sp.]